MSAEFFENMERIKQIIDRIKFLEGSHNIIDSRFLPKTEELIVSLESFEKDIKSELVKFYKKVQVTPKKTKKSKGKKQ